MSPAITVRDLTKRFNKVHALTDGRLTVERGEIHALLGANGCGKSTLSKIVAGAYAPTSGTVLIDGKEVSFRSPRDAEQMGIALFYQELSLIPKMSVEANIFCGENRGMLLAHLTMAKCARTHSLCWRCSRMRSGMIFDPIYWWRI